MAGRGVHGTRAGFQFHVVGADHDRVAIEERMTHGSADEGFAHHHPAQRMTRRFRDAREQWQRRALPPSTHVFTIDAVDREYSASGLIAIATFAGSVQGVVVQITIESGVPSSCACPCALRYRRAAHRSRENARRSIARRVFLIFDLGFGERGLVVDAPQRGAQALIELLLLRPDPRARRRSCLRTLGAIVMYGSSYLPEHAHAQDRIALTVRASRARVRGIFRAVRADRRGGNPA